MGPLVVVVDAPRFDLCLRVVEIDKPFFVQALVAELAVEALDETVFHGLAGANEVEVHAVTVRPGIKLAAGEFWTVVGREGGRQSGRGCEPVELARDPRGRQRRIDDDRRALLADDVDDREHPEACVPTRACR